MNYPYAVRSAGTGAADDNTSKAPFSPLRAGPPGDHVALDEVLGGGGGSGVHAARADLRRQFARKVLGQVFVMLLEVVVVCAVGMLHGDRARQYLVRGRGHHPS